MAKALVYVGRQSLADDISPDDLVVEIGRNKFYFTYGLEEMQLSDRQEGRLFVNRVLELELPRSLSRCVAANAITRQQIYVWITRLARRAEARTVAEAKAEAERIEQAELTETTLGGGSKMKTKQQQQRLLSKKEAKHYADHISGIDSSDIDANADHEDSERRDAAEAAVLEAALELEEREAENQQSGFESRDAVLPS